MDAAIGAEGVVSEDGAFLHLTLMLGRGKSLQAKVTQIGGSVLKAVLPAITCPAQIGPKCAHLRPNLRRLSVSRPERCGCSSASRRSTQKNAKTTGGRNRSERRH